MQQRQACEGCHRGVSVFAPHQALQLRQDSLRCRFRKPCGVALNPRHGLAGDGERDFRHQPQSPQQPQRVVDEVGFRDGGQAALLEVAQSSCGVPQLSPGLERHGDGIEPVVAPPEVVFDAVSVLSGDVDRPAPKHQPSNAPFRVEHHTRAMELLGQGLGQGDGIGWDHKVKIRLLLETVQQAIPHGATHQRRALRKPCQGERPLGWSQSLSQLVKQCVAGALGHQNGGSERPREACASAWIAAGSTVVRPITQLSVSMVFRI